MTAEGVGPEAAARQARYVVLDEIAQRLGAAAVLLGHTRDDQAETVLLGLARGSGGRSLAGMRRSFELYRRPLLDVSRDDTVTACQVEGLETWVDPHNADPAYLRARVRGRVLPTLEDELGPGVAATLARTADQLRIDMDHLDDLADRALAALGDPLPVADLGCAADRRTTPGAAARRRPTPAHPPPSCSTSTCSPSTRCSPTGTARSGSTCPGHPSRGAASRRQRERNASCCCSSRGAQSAPGSDLPSRAARPRPRAARAREPAQARRRPTTP